MNRCGFRNHLFAFDEGSLALHENLMPCVIVGLQNQVVVSGTHDWVTADVVAIRPGVPHGVTVGVGGAAIVYFDGVQFANDRRLFWSLPPDWRDMPRCFDGTDLDGLARFRNRIDQSVSPPDHSVLKIVQQLYDDPFQRQTQTDLAHSLGLERTQALRHFKATTGLTFRKFKIWAGIVAATHAAAAGDAIGSAAISAGFSDAAHLARTANTVFGITPTMGLSGLGQIVSLPS